MKYLARVISTGCGAGYFPIAPGTMGAVVMLIIYWLIPPLTTFQLLLLILGLMVVGIYSASVTEREVKAKSGAVAGSDPGIVVIDEIIGMLIALIAIPKSMRYLIATFLLFRLFDITKPFPVRRIEKLPSGWGIVLDDVLAGIYANLLIQIGRAIF